MTQNNDVRANGGWQGMNWIRKEKRLAIYLRDGMCCAYCSATLEDGATLTLDHVNPHSNGGDNHESNLVTCCKSCNDSRGNRTVAAFGRYIGNPEAYKTVRRLTARSLVQYLQLSKEILASRVFTRAVKHAAKKFAA